MTDIPLITNTNAVELDVNPPTDNTNTTNEKQQQSLPQSQPQQPQTTSKPTSASIEGVGDVEAIVSNQNDEDNYLIATFLKNKQWNIIFCCILLLIIITELMYRNALFDYSLDFEADIQWGLKNSTIKVFNFFTTIGGEVFFGASAVIILFFFPLTKFVVFAYSLVFAIYIHCVMKIWYGDGRPFWYASNLFKNECLGGFGNPSGHSFISVVAYLSLCHYILNSTIRFRESSISKIILYFIFSIIIGFVIYSRLILGVHSLDQVIYGALLGLWQFIFVNFIFKADLMPVKYYRKQFREKKNIIINLSFLLCCVVLAIISSLIFNQYDYTDLNEKINVHCKDLPKNSRFNIDGLIGSMIILLLVGLYLGQVRFWKLIDVKYKGKQMFSGDINPNEGGVSLEKGGNAGKNEDEIIDELLNNWNKNSGELCKKFVNFIKVLGVIIVCLIPAILYIVIPSSANIIVIFLFKTLIPFISSIYLLSGYGLYYIIDICCGNKDTLIKNATKKK